MTDPTPKLDDMMKNRCPCCGGAIQMEEPIESTAMKGEGETLKPEEQAAEKIDAIADNYEPDGVCRMVASDIADAIRALAKDQPSTET